MARRGLWIGALAWTCACSMRTGGTLEPVDPDAGHFDATTHSASPDAKVEPDAASDPDASAVEAGQDGPDAASDAGDPSADAAPDASRDAALDAAGDTGTEGGRDAGSEAGTDVDGSQPCDGVDCSHLDSACVSGTCEPFSGLCMRVLTPYGTPCGDAPEGACLPQPLCDGAGSCVPRTPVAGTPCGDAPADACDAPDTCDGSGTCVAAFAPAGLACAPSDDPCMLDGECDGTGFCESVGPAPEGTPCGGAPSRECDARDRCDGTGTCVELVAADGTECADCAAGECAQCAGGVCESASCEPLGSDTLGTALCAASTADLPCPDIRETGQRLKLGDDSSSLLFLVGFEFAFLGKPVHSFVVHADGVIGMGENPLLHAAAGDLEEYGGAPPLLAAFWDDLIGEPAGDGTVYWQQLGSPGNDPRLVVQWASRRKKAGDIDVRAVLHGGSDLVELCYVDTDVGDVAFDAGATASVGTSGALGDPRFIYSVAEPRVPSGTYLRLEPSALLFEGFEGLDSLREADGWEFPFSDSPFTVDHDDAASGLWSLNHSAAGDLGLASYAFDSPVSRGVVRLEADVRVDLADDPVSVVQLGLVQAGGGPTPHRRRIDLTL